MYGDTAAARRRVSQLREQSGDIRALAERLVAQAEAVPWRGRAAESMRERVHERAGQLREAADLHETAAESLGRHLAEVDRLKEAIDVRQHKATALVADADARRSRQDHRPEAEQPPGDEALLAFAPPPDGHRDWLDVELPGL